MRKRVRIILLAALAVLIAGAVIFVMMNPIQVVMAFSGLFKGPDLLYVNEDEIYEGDGELQPGSLWMDTDGNSIQAHGGQVQYLPVPDEDGGTAWCYLWIGENKSNGHYGNNIAVYSSEDLLSWTFKGNVLRSIGSREELEEDPYFTELYGDCTEEELDEIYAALNTSAVIERPKMLYNETTDQYVIWFHHDSAAKEGGYTYDAGMAGVAVSDSPYGPFRFIGRYRLDHCPEGELDCFPFSEGEARDMNLFQDDDGTAYIVYTSENNKTLYISRLNESYTGLSADPEEAVCGEDYIRLFPGSMREAPVLIKNEGRYYLMSSGTTGWFSNQARVWSADEIFGTWRNDGNPCEGDGADLTFDTQSTSIFRSEDGEWVYYGDRWNASDLADSRYIWLPVTFTDEKLTIRWESEWSLE